MSGRPGEDLRVLPGPGLPHGLMLPASDLQERFSRSPGPGGQSVNTADSQVELSVDLSTSALDDAQRARARRWLAGRLTGDRLVVVAHEHRSQHRNRVAARDRLAGLLRDALAPPPKVRVPTRPSRSARRRRLDEKRQRGQTKALRGRVRD